jgi:hypothetical protein
MARLNASISASSRHRDLSAGLALATAPTGRSPHEAGREDCDPATERHGPGWFESSWDLQRGLDVREGLPSDCRWQEWVEAWLHA